MPIMDWMSTLFVCYVTEGERIVMRTIETSRNGRDYYVFYDEVDEGRVYYIFMDLKSLGSLLSEPTHKIKTKIKN